MGATFISDFLCELLYTFQKQWNPSIAYFALDYRRMEEARPVHKKGTTNSWSGKCFYAFFICVLFVFFL